MDFRTVEIRLGQLKRIEANEAKKNKSEKEEDTEKKE